VTTLNVVLTHLPAPEVYEGVQYLHGIAPASRFAICHGGRFEDFSRLEYTDKVFVDDPSLRAPPRTFQSYHETFALLYDRFLRNDPILGSVYIFEYDHLILDGDFEQRITDLAVASGADFMGKTCVERTGTNWLHYLRFRNDRRLLTHLRSVSVHEDCARMYGCLGNGFWLTRAALEAYLAVIEHPPCYGELYVPTLLHHLGFRVVDVDGHGDLYRYVRPDGEFLLSEVLRLKHHGETFVHPYKGTGGIHALRGASSGTRASAA